MSEKDLNTLFDEAFANAQLIPQDSVPQDMQLILYGLYKQATSETTTPLMFQNPQDIINAFKLNAWMQVKHLTVDEAKSEYIRIINELLKRKKSLSTTAMKKSLLWVACVSLMMASCKKENELIEVKIPEPEVATNISALGNPADVKVTEGGIFQMRGLKYAYDGLEPHIDGRTMEIHYSKHHLGYANKLNKAVIGTDLELKTVEDILKNLDVNNKEIRNNAGGYYNHNLFFEILNPKGGGTPTGALAEAITTEMGSFDNLQKQLTDAASGQFGSGWAWLVVTRDGKLAVTSTANQDNPLMPNAEVRGTPILAIDVWEHAYYLNYQNKRNEYITAIFNVIDWNVVNIKYETAISKI